MKVLLLLHLLLMLVGCNSEYASLSAIRKTKIKVIATLPASITADKIMLWGQGSDGNSFARVIRQNEETSLIFNNAGYTLYAIAWTGAELTGDVYCSTSSAQLLGPDLPLNLNLTNADCRVPHFDGGVVPGGPLNKLGDVKVEWCDNVVNVSDPIENCTDDLADVDRITARGHGMSYRYALSTYDKKGSKYSLKSETIYSACLAGFPGVGNELKGSAFGFADQLPVGDGSTTPFHISLQVFPSDTFCATSTPMHTVTFENGIKKNSNKTNYITDGATFHKLYVKMSTNEVCSAMAKMNQFAGGNGTTMSPFLICDETQFYNTLQIPNSSFKLMNDIDLTNRYYGITTLPNIPNNLTCLENGSNFVPLGYDLATCTPSLETFSFQDFDGGGKTIKGLRILMPDNDNVGLYTKKYGGQIRRLNLENSVIKGKNYVGGLVGYTESRFFNITGDGLYVISTASLAGGLAGSNANHPTNCSFTNIKLNNVNVSGAGSSIGGLIGQSTSCDFSAISVSGHVYGTNSSIGGIAANVANATMSNTSFEGTVRGGTVVGGIAGELYLSQVNRVYVVGGVYATYTAANTRLGGLFGYTNGAYNAATNFLTNSYFFGKVHDFCTAGVNCKIANIVGDAGAWAMINFASNTYLTPTAVGGKAPFNGGVSRPESDFYSIAAWSSTYQRTTDDLPRLYHEVASTTIDIKHACRNTPNAGATVADQITLGRGTDANPILICSFSQLKDMQANAVHATKSYKLLTSIVATEDFTPSSMTFSGKLDGTNKAIVNLSVTGGVGTDIAWWNTIASTGVMKDLYLFNAYINDPSTLAGSSALIATFNNGLLDKTHALLVRATPGSGGNHAVYVNRNDGTIRGAYINSSATIRNNYSAGVYFNMGEISDSNFNSYNSGSGAWVTSNIAGAVFDNQGIFRRNEISATILDASPGATDANIAFAAVNNTGTIADVHIQPTSYIVSRNAVTHGVVVNNQNTGTIERIFNEGRVTVYNYGLPNLTPVLANDFLQSASNTIGVNDGAVSQLIYKYFARWSFPSQYGFVSRTDASATECVYDLSGGMNGTWETALNTSISRFGIMVSAADDPIMLTRTPIFTAGNDTFWAEKTTACNAAFGNPVIHYNPIDMFAGVGLITQAQSLNFTTFSGWTGAYDSGVSTTPFDNYQYNLWQGNVTTKPVWIFDSTNGMRLFR